MHPLTAMGDHLSGTYMANAIVLALIAKEKTGKGQKIDIAIYDALYSVLEGNPITVSMFGEINDRTGNADPTAAPYDTFETNDGYVAVGVSTDKQWFNFCEALGWEDLKNNERYFDNGERVRLYYDGLRDEIESRTKKMSKFEIEDKLGEAHVSCGAVYTVTEAMATDQVKERDMLVNVYDEGIGEEIGIPGAIIKFSETLGGVECGAPIMGKHTAEYLSALGYTEEQMAKLAENNVIQMA